MNDHIGDSNEMVSDHIPDTRKMSDTPKLSQQDNHANFPIDTPTLIATLYELSDGGTAEWWPDYIREYIDREGVLFYMSDGGARHAVGVQMRQSDILDIIRGSAERWLRARGWTVVSIGDSTAYAKRLVGNTDSLADAIRAEMGRGG